MLQSQKLEIKSTEIRARLAELASLDTVTDEERAELREKTTELRDSETQRVAALEVEAHDTEKRKAEGLAGSEEIDAEHRERLKILGKARIGKVLPSGS